MKIPKIVFFDMGDTIVTIRGGSSFDPEAGFAAVLEQMKAEGPDIPASALAEDYAALKASRRFQTREGGVDATMNTPFSVSLRLLLESRGIHLRATWEEAAALYWRERNAYELCDGIGQLLAGLRQLGIRTAMITNNLFSSDTVQKRLDELLPEHGMEFIVSSADYAVSKPDPKLFAVALHRAGVQADDAWHAGDRLDCDVEGAAAVGMYPVWYRRSEGLNDLKKTSLPHQAVRHWDELLAYVRTLS